MIKKKLQNLNLQDEIEILGFEKYYNWLWAIYQEINQSKRLSARQNI